MITTIRPLLSKEVHYHFAVSMGVDSVAAYCWMLCKGYRVSPIHFNHKLRPQNDEMEAKYKEMCKYFNVDSVVGYGENCKTEADCRNQRLKFFAQFLDSKIITAHHLSDCVESYLMNCFRGHPDHDFFSLSTQFENFEIIHPFLLSTKADFYQYAERNDFLKFVIEDETNRSTKGSRRNWIRNFIVPEMKNQKMNLENFCRRKIESLIGLKQ